MVETPLGILNKVDNILPKDRITEFFLAFGSVFGFFGLGHELGLFSFKIR